MRRTIMRRTPSWLGVLLSVLVAGCNLSDLTSGSAEGSGAGSGGAQSPGGGGSQALGGQAGAASGGGNGAPDESCEAFDFCETFDAEGPPSSTQFSLIRVKANSTVTQSEGHLISNISEGLDCTYADVSRTFGGPFSSFELDTRMLRETGTSGFFLTLNQPNSEGPDCLHLFALSDGGIMLQTNTPNPDQPDGTDSETSSLDLPVPENEWVDLSVRISIDPIEGSEFILAAGGREATVSRTACRGMSSVDITLGFFCHGAGGQLLFDHLGVTLKP